MGLKAKKKRGRRPSLPSPRHLHPCRELWAPPSSPAVLWSRSLPLHVTVCLPHDCGHCPQEHLCAPVCSCREKTLPGCELAGQDFNESCQGVLSNATKPSTWSFAQLWKAGSAERDSAQPRTVSCVCSFPRLILGAVVVRTPPSPCHTASPRNCVEHTQRARHREAEERPCPCVRSLSHCGAGPRRTCPGPTSGTPLGCLVFMGGYTWETGS